MYRFKKHIALLFLIAVVLPSLLQLEHVFENHSHNMCTSDYEHHFHADDDFDCSQLHYQITVFSDGLSYVNDIIAINSYLRKYNKQPQKNKLTLFSKIFSRGPPLV